MEKDIYWVWNSPNLNHKRDLLEIKKITSEFNFQCIFAEYVGVGNQDQCGWAMQVEAKITQ